MTSDEVILRPTAPWWRIPWREVFEYRELLWFMAKRNFTVSYKQTVLGPLWFVVGPLATTVVFTVVFGRIAKVSTDGTQPFLFYLGGTVLWNFFSACLNAASGSLSSNVHLFSKVYFPRLVMPLASVLTCVPSLLLGLAIFAIVHGLFLLAGTPCPAVHPVRWLAIPLLAGQAALAGLGTGLLFAAATVKYRDLRFAIPIITRFWFYATPVVYPASYLRGTPALRWFGLNPMAPVVEAGRWALLGTDFPDIGMVAIGIGVSIVLFLLGVIIFTRVERTFVDSI
ncbi:MAG: ABC transporter permease [Kiritimatiellia bacterium]